jgi:Fe-S cluster assembly protein SufD
MNVMPARTAAEESLGHSLPHRRMEDWRWTDLRQLIDRPYPPMDAASADPAQIERLVRTSPFEGIERARLVFVNGRYDARLSTMPNGVVKPRVEIEEPVAAINRSLAGDGARLALSGVADTPVEIVFVTTDAAPRSVAALNVIEVAPGAAATVIETHLGEGSYLSNSVTEIRLGDGARLDRIKVERESPDAIHLSHVHASLAASSIYRDFTLTSGSRVNRQNGTVVFGGKGADARVSGAYLLSGRQHADTKLVVDHAVAECTSRELFKCVLDGSARGIFQGKVVVRPDAQKTDGKQSSHALLLAETAEFDAKPELEIFADDVVCGHGATAGDLDHDQLFYLRSRGITETEAKSLLIAAFASEAFDAVAHDGIRAALEAVTARWLASHGRPA